MQIEYLSWRAYLIYITTQNNVSYKYKSIRELSHTKSILKGGQGNVTNIDLQNVEQCWQGGIFTAKFHCRHVLCNAAHCSRIRKRKKKIGLFKKEAFIYIHKIRILLLVNSRQKYLPYAHHYNPLLIRNCSWILTIHKGIHKWTLKVGKKYTNRRF